MQREEIAPVLQPGSRLYILVARGAFPVSLVAYGSVAWLLWDHIDSTLSVFWYFVLLRILAGVLCFTCERLIPFERKRLEPGELRADAAFYGMNHFVIIPAIGLAHLTVYQWIASATGRGELIALDQAPLWLEVTVGFLALEWGAYWGHRFVHRNRFFWRGHATHHSPHHIYWLNNYRNHFLSYIMSFVFIVTPAYLLGLSHEFLLARYALFLLLGPYQHVNADFRLGWLNYLFSAAPNHRFHHSENPSEANANFGLMTSVFDILHGTFVRGDRRPTPRRMGLFADIPGYRRHGFLFQTFAPFRRRIWAAYPWRKPQIHHQRIF